MNTAGRITERVSSMMINRNGILNNVKNDRWNVILDIDGIDDRFEIDESLISALESRFGKDETVDMLVSILYKKVETMLYEHYTMDKERDYVCSC